MNYKRPYEGKEQGKSIREILAMWPGKLLNDNDYLRIIHYIPKDHTEENL